MDLTAKKFESAIGLARATAEARCGGKPTASDVAMAMLDVPLGDLKAVAAAMAKVVARPDRHATPGAIVPGWLPADPPASWPREASAIAEILMGDRCGAFHETRAEALGQLVPDECHAAAAALLSGSLRDYPRLDEAMGVAASLAEAAGLPADPTLLARLVATGILPEFEAARDDLERSLQTEREAIPPWMVAARIMGGMTEARLDALGEAAALARKSGDIPEARSGKAPGADGGMAARSI